MHNNLFRYGFWLLRQQDGIPWVIKDHSYIDFYRKAYDYEQDPARKDIHFHAIKDSEIRKEYHMGSIKQINHAIQYDDKPNRELKESQWELFKITISFTPISMMTFITFGT